MSTPDTSPVDPAPFDYDALAAPTLLHAIERALADGSGTTIGFDHHDHALAEVWALSGRLARFLAGRIEPGDRVGVMARNGLAAVLTWWATARCGGIVVPFNVDNAGDILTHQIRDSDPALVVLAGEFVPTFLRADDRDHSAAPLPILVDGDHAAAAAAVSAAGRVAEVLAFDAALGEGDGRFDRPLPGPLDVSHLVYTSGTTGPSKACIVPHRYVANFSLRVAQNLARRPEEKLWSPMPIFHLSGITHLGGTVLLGSDIEIASRFSVSRFWDDVERSGASVAALMGTMLTMIAQAPQTPAATRYFGRLRAVSGSPVSVELAAQWAERFGVHHAGAGTYGMTEAALITMTPPGGHRPGTAGKACADFALRIVDEDAREVPAGTVGQIECRPRAEGIMFSGYWNQPEHTAAVFREDGWFRTGDLGSIDEDGYLIFADRGKDYLRRGGENISSQEVEAVFRRHPAIAEVAVHAVPSPLGEDDVKVTAVLRAGAEASEPELYEWAAPQLPRYAAPSYIEFRAELPKNQVGRILKYRLREEGVTPGTWVRRRR
jgi:crotonobetaine/carnitine-CoA ligase